MTYIEPLAVDYGVHMAREARELRSSYELQFEIEDARRRYLRSLSAMDLADECCDDELVSLVQAGDANAVGRWLLTRVAAYVDRLAEQEVLL